MTPHQHLLQMFRIPVHTPGNKTGIRAHGQRQRIKGMVDAAKGRGLGLLVRFGSGRILTLRQPVNLVIEQQDVHIKISAQQMNGMISPNT